MPIIKSAKDKLRKDRKKTKRNSAYKESFRKTLKGLRTSSLTKKTAKAVQEAYSKIDKALKKKIISKNKAARLKSQAGKLVNKK